MKASRLPIKFRELSFVTTSVSLILDIDMNIVAGVGGVTSLYGISETKVPKTYMQILEFRASRNWVSLGQCLDATASPESRLNEINLSNSLSTILVSPTGGLFIEAHLRIPETETIYIVLTNTGVTVDRAGLKSAELLASVVEKTIVDFPEAYNALGASLQFDRDDCRDVMLLRSSGEVILHRPAHNEGSATKKIRSIYEVLPDFRRAVSYLKANDSYRSLVGGEQNSSAKNIIVDIAKIPSWQGGLDMLSAKITKVCMNKSCPFSLYRRVESLYPSLTEKEVEVLARYASGDAIKIIASDLGKSQVTVGLQIRGAMHKIGATNLTALQSEVLIRCNL